MSDTFSADIATLTKVHAETVPETEPAAFVKPPQLRVPTILTFVLTAFWVLTLRSTIAPDEGTLVVANWNALRLQATFLFQQGSGPTVYSDIAWQLYSWGGLAAVRLFSLACLLGAMYLIMKTTAYLFNKRAGLMAAGVMGFSAPVVYVGHLATSDSMIMLLLAAALYLGVVKDSSSTAMASGCLLGIAVLTKYSAVAFVPFLVLLTLFSYEYLRKPAGRLRWMRTFGVASTVSIFLLAAWVYNGMPETYVAGDTVPVDQLLGLVPRLMWITLLLPVYALFNLAHHRKYHMMTFGLILVGAAVVIPLAQATMWEPDSYEKHLAYTAMFLAPLAGWALARPWKNAIWPVPLCFLMVIAMTWGAIKSHDLDAPTGVVSTHAEE